MKFHQIFIITFLLSINLVAQENSGVLKYGQYSNKFVIDTTSMSDSYLKSILLDNFEKKRKALAADIDLYNLMFDKGKSVFSAINMMDSDSNDALEKSLAKGTYYINTIEKTIHHEGDFFGQNLIIYYDKPLYEWVVENKKKIINNYNCQKATTIVENTNGVKTKVTAWFTNDLNLNYGPKNYFGLPGLIIELHELDSVYYLKSLKFNNQKLDIPNKGKLVSFEEYEKMIKGAIKF
jgi:GLPGLI family protein